MVGLNFVIPFSKGILRENVFLSCLARLSCSVEQRRSAGKIRKRQLALSRALKQCGCSEGVSSVLSAGNAALFSREAVHLNAACVAESILLRWCLFRRCGHAQLRAMDTRSGELRKRATASEAVSLRLVVSVRGSCTFQGEAWDVYWRL